MLKKLLGYLCISMCIICIISTIYISVSSHEYLDSIMGLIIVAVICGLYAYYLLKKTPTNISPIRIFLDVNCVGGCILGIYMAFAEPEENMGANMAATVFCAILSVLLLKKQNSVDQPKAADILLENDTPISSPSQIQDVMETATQASNVAAIIANITPASVPQETLIAMQQTYSPMQAQNDIRILEDSLKTLQKTTNLETFFSRYELAMQKALTLEQAQQAGLPIKLNISSQTIVAYKNQRSGQVLMTAYQKEKQSINNLKTVQGKLNRVNKFLELLSKYETELEFVNYYEEILSTLKDFRRQLNS